MEDDSLRGRGLVATALIVLAVVALCAAGASAQIAANDADAEREDAERLADVGVAVAARGVDAARAVRDLARAAASNPAAAFAAPPESVRAAGMAAFDGRRLESTAGGPVDALVASPEVVIAAGTARDSARVVLSSPTADGEVAVVVALYRGEGGLTTDPLTSSTAMRREAAVSFVVAALDTTALLPRDAGDARILDGSTVLDGPPGPREGATVAVTIAGRVWTVEVPLSSGGTPGAAVAIVAAGLVLVAGVVVGSAWLTTAAGRARRLAQARGVQSETIRRLAPVVQRSLDVADVLPAIAVQLAEDLDVTGMSLATGHRAEETELFSHGVAVDRSAVPPAELPAILPAGQTLAIALRSAGRGVAVLRLRAARDLDQIELESVQAASELLTAALINARAFERQQHAVHALRDLDELKTVFLGVASHELRTPVTAIGGFARLLTSRWDEMPEDRRRLLASRIDANSAALDSLVQDLLDFSRLERGRLVVNDEPVDVAAGLEAVVDRLSPIWAGRHVELVVRDRPVVMADGDAVERVASNLLSNAVKFSPDDTDVTATVGIDGSDAVLTVDDAGPGVPVEERERIFSRFFRGSGPEVVRTRGTGIGLSVVREFVDQMGGSIAVDRSPAGGARFVVRLPLADGRHDDGGTP